MPTLAVTVRGRRPIAAVAVRRGRASTLASGLIATFAAALAFGCAPAREPRSATTPTAGELGPLPPGSAQVCVVRPERTASDVSMPVRDNGRLVGATRGTTYFCYLAASGEHQITSVDDDTGPTLLRAHAGARYWIHQDVVELGGQVHAHLDFVEEAAALELLDACETRVRVSVPGHEDEQAAQPIAPARAM